MFGKLNKLKQAAEFASKAKKAFPMNRRKFLQGVGSLGLSATLPGGIKLLPKVTEAAGKAQVFGRAPWISSMTTALKTAVASKGSTFLPNGGKIKYIKAPRNKYEPHTLEVKTTDGETDIISFKDDTSEIDIKFEVADDFHNNQHIVIDKKTGDTQFVDENFYMTSPEDYAKDDPIIYDVLSSQEDISKRYGLAKGDTIDGEMIDRLAIPEDSGYEYLFERHADTFSPFGNLFKTKQSAETLKKSQQAAKQNTEIKQMDDWESQFRGGTMHGYNIGGIVNKLRTVGSLTKKLNPTKPVGKIASGLQQIAKPKTKAADEVIDYDLTDVRDDIYLNTPKGPYTIADQSGARVLDRDFETLDEARKAVTEMGDLRLSDPSTFQIFGARPPKTAEGISRSAPSVSLSKADDARMPAMFWKSREEIANTQQSVMSGKQWLAYLKNKGVGDIELKDTSLGFHLSSQPNAKITKAQLLDDFDDISPQIEVKMLGLRDNKSQIEDAVKFVKQTVSNPPVYMDSKTRRILNTLKKPLNNIRQSQGATANDITSLTNVLNKGFKQEFGIDQIIGKGLDPKIKLPFMAKKTALIFDDILNQGGIKFKASGKPKHAGDQTMPGGSNYQEMLFSYKPGRYRQNDPIYNEGHDFAGQRPSNMFVWVRFSDRTDEYGRKLLFVEEIQSDMHAKARTKGTYSTGYAPRGDLYDPDTAKLRKIQDQLQNIQGKVDDAEGLNLGNLRKQQDKLIKEADKLKPGGKKYKSQSGIPEGPLADSKDHGRFIMQYLMRAAKESGDYDGIALSSAKVKGDEKTGFYDKIMIPQLKKISKKSGATLTDTVIVDGQGQPYDNIPVLLLKDKKGIIPLKDISVYNKGGLVG